MQTIERFAVGMFVNFLNECSCSTLEQILPELCCRTTEATELLNEAVISRGLLILILLTRHVLVADDETKSKIARSFKTLNFNRQFYSL